jgi:hypothetical protein
MRIFFGTDACERGAAGIIERILFALSSRHRSS